MRGTLGRARAWDVHPVRAPLQGGTATLIVGPSAAVMRGRLPNGESSHVHANLRPLKVGLNLLHLVPGQTGGSEVYAMHLVPALLEGGGVELVLFASREGAPGL